ncbi:MAG: response regulator [Deltaproteobacteria bacterium]|nr:response regulator [Deltaproteobacteria bacterium]
MSVHSALGVWMLDLESGALRCSAEMVALVGAAVVDRAGWIARVDEKAELGAALDAGEAFDLEVTVGGRQLYVCGRRVGGELVGTCESLEVQLQRALVDRIASVSTFAASIAHELNNPLAVAVANVEMIQDALPVDVERDEMFRDSREAMARMQSIIRGLKTFTRSELARVERVDLEHVLESAITVANHEIVRRAKLVRDFVPLPAVEASEAQLGHVFVNLLVNAAQAIEAGAVERNEIRVATRVGPGSRVAVEIRDTGPGIARENRARIFEPFFTTKPIGQGVGLGLAVCRNVVRSFGGEITFDSASGGTVFRVLLPIAGPTVSVAPVRSAVEEISARVLIVDDEVLFTNTLRRLLGTDHDLTIVNSADTALSLLVGGDRFDVVLCDLMMPGIGGMGLYQRVLEVAPEQAHRFIFITGGASTPTSQRFLEQLTQPCFEKPCDFKQLRAAIAKTASKPPLA